MKVKKHALIIIPFIVIMAVFSYWAVMKSGMFIDETYTYCLSNGSYPPFVDAGNSIKGNSMIDKTITKEELHDLIFAEDDKFDFGNVYRNYSQDNHPPLYGFLLHSVSSTAEIVRGGVKCEGLILNFIIYLLVLVMLYKLCKKLFFSTKIGLLGIILYGLSAMGLSTALMIRMYILLTLFTVILAYSVVSLMKDGKWYWYMAVMLIIFLGLFTQYYFVFYAFFLCATFDIYTLAKKEYKKMLLFSIFALLGVLCMYVIYPVCIDHLFADKYVAGQTVTQNLLQISNYGRKLISYIRGTMYDLRTAVMIGTLGTAALIITVLYKKNIRILLKEESVIQAIVVILPAFLSFVMIGAGNPENLQATRYIYNISPIFVLAVCLVLFLLAKSYTNKLGNKALKNSLIIVFLIFSALCTYVYRPAYLYPEQKLYTTIVEKYANAPCIYVNNNYNAPLTADFMQLMEFDDVFVTNNTNSEPMQDYIRKKKNQENAVVYIDTSETWSSGYEPQKILHELIENTEYTAYEELYSQGLSNAYVLVKK